MGLVVNERVDQIPREIVEGFKSIGVGDIGHIQEFGFMDNAIRPVWRDIRLVGTAVTCRMPGFDTTANRAVIDSAQDGDVIVIEQSGDTKTAAMGGGAGLLAIVKGVAGLIVDGAVTDTMEFEDLKWPVYSRTVSGLVGRKIQMYGEVNTTICCGGVPVSPGDLIVADDDGIVVIRPEEAADLLRQCQERFGDTPSIRQWVRDGKRLEDYPAVKKYYETRPGVLTTEGIRTRSA
jgi:regulator of RNase E activity RraA